MIHNRGTNAVAILELTCPLESVHHLESARARKLAKEDYQLLLSELDHLGIVCSYNTIEISVLGHYLPVSLALFRNCVNFIQNDFVLSTSQCKKIFDQGAAVSIRSSRRIFLARSSQEWCMETWHCFIFSLNLYVAVCVFVFCVYPCHAHLGACVARFCGSMCPRTVIYTVFLYIIMIDGSLSCTEL